MVRVEIVRNVTILASPGLESLQLTLGLTHITVEIIEVAQVLRLGPRICVGGVEALVVLDKHENAVLTCLFD